MGHTNGGVGIGSVCTPEMAGRVKTLLGRAAIASRVDLKAWVATGNLPGGATITGAQFGRALAALGAGIIFGGEADDAGGDV